MNKQKQWQQINSGKWREGWAGNNDKPAICTIQTCLQENLRRFEFTFCLLLLLLLTSRHIYNFKFMYWFLFLTVFVLGNYIEFMRPISHYFVDLFNSIAWKGLEALKKVANKRGLSVIKEHYKLNST